MNKRNTDMTYGGKMRIKERLKKRKHKVQKTVQEFQHKGK